MSNIKIKIRHVDFYPDEWLSGTARMSPLDVGVYITACALIYSHSGEIEESELDRFLTAHGNALRASVQRLIASGKLYRDGSKIGSIRCGNELEKAQKRVRNALENGQKGGRPVSTFHKNQELTESGGKTLPITTNYQPDIREDSPPPLSPTSAATVPAQEPADMDGEADDEPRAKRRRAQRNGIDRRTAKAWFDKFYAAYPRPVGADAAFAKYLIALKQATPEELLASAERYAAIREGEDHKYTAHPATWLHQGRYKDQAMQPLRDVPTGPPPNMRDIYPDYEEPETLH